MYLKNIFWFIGMMLFSSSIWGETVVNCPENIMCNGSSSATCSVGIKVAIPIYSYNITAGTYSLLSAVQTPTHADCDYIKTENNTSSMIGFIFTATIVDHPHVNNLKSKPIKILVF